MPARFRPACEQTFVALNCAAIPEQLFEAELFGHESGAFTGAQGKRIGKLEYANGGTVFLDEIESMPLAQQAKLLRVLQEQKLERLGPTRASPSTCGSLPRPNPICLKRPAPGAFVKTLPTV